MKKFAMIVGVIVSLGVIGAAIVGTLYHIDKMKLDVIQYKEDQQEYKKQHKKDLAFTDVRFLENYRRDLEQRIWAMERNYPNSYHRMSEYKKLIADLRQINMKIQAFYNRKGG